MPLLHARQLFFAEAAGLLLGEIGIMAAGNGVIHPFRNIYGMIAYAFKVFGYHKVVKAKLTVLVILKQAYYFLLYFDKQIVHGVVHTVDAAGLFKIPAHK